jgi:hypothetical protein
MRRPALRRWARHPLDWREDTEKENIMLNLTKVHFVPTFEGAMERVVVRNFRRVA